MKALDSRPPSSPGPVAKAQVRTPSGGIALEQQKGRCAGLPRSAARSTHSCWPARYCRANSHNSHNERGVDGRAALDFCCAQVRERRSDSRHIRAGRFGNPMRIAAAGLITVDPGKAFPGYTLLAPLRALLPSARHARRSGACMAAAGSPREGNSVWNAGRAIEAVPKLVWG